MAIASPVTQRSTVVALLLLTFATGVVDAISVLVLGHVFVANMTGNVIFLGFWFVPHSGVDVTGALVAFMGFVLGTVVGGRLRRHLDSHVRNWLTTALGVEVVLLTVLSVLCGTGVLAYDDNRKLILIVLAMTFGIQNATARQFGIQELSTTVLTPPTWASATLRMEPWTRALITSALGELICVSITKASQATAVSRNPPP